MAQGIRKEILGTNTIMTPVLRQETTIVENLFCCWILEEVRSNNCDNAELFVRMRIRSSYFSLWSLSFRIVNGR